MKKKFSRLMGVGLAVVIVTTMLVGVLPVSAGTLAWGTETIPSTTSKVIVTEAINDIAIGPDGTTIYAALSPNTLYKSTDAGKTWSGLTAPGAAADLVAVAPDDTDLIAVADGTTVWISTNGGSTFNTLGTPTGTGGDITAINDVDISRELSGIHYIAAGGTRTAAAQLSYFNYGAAAPAWLDAAGGDWNSTITAATDNILAIAFSPNFPSDRIVMAVTFDATNRLEFQIGSFAAKDWNLNVGGFTSYPVDLDVVATAAAAASISVDANYLGSDEATRVVFVGAETTAGDAGGIYRVDDNSVEDLKTGVAIQSVAYNTAATKLVAGEGSTGNNVYRSADPTASSPTVSGASTYKRTGINNNTTTVLVGWSGSDVVAASGGTDGAFSVSVDDGKTFNDISLVNSAMTNLTDVAVSADGSMVYLVANDNTDTSLWRKASSWQRVFTAAAATAFVVRPAPDDWDVVYLAEVGTTNIFYTNDGGENKWTLRYGGVNVGDLAVESADVAYALTSGANNTVSKSDNAGFIWDSAENTGNGGNNHMIKSLGEDLVIVGSVDGFVAYSDDGNDSWTAISDPLGGTPLLTQVTASGLADGDFIYAATSELGGNISRLEIGVDDWDDIISGTTTTAAGDLPANAAMGVYGLALEDGVLYASASDGTDSGLWRTLSPSTADDGSTWSYKLTTDATNIDLGDGPQGLLVSAGSTKLWAIDQDNAKLYSFTDTTAVEVPSLTGPTDGFSVAMNPQTGRALDVAFNWDRLSKSTDYNLEIGLDPDFDQSVRTENVDSSSSKVVLILGPFTAGGGGTLEWMAGETYYWRVRAASNGPLYSNWSGVNSFTIEEADEPLPPVIIQQPPAPVIEVPVIEMPTITVTIPDIILPAPQPVPDIIIPQAPVAPAPITPAYIWAIVIIGAILVIAVVVLIVRTRRPV